MSSVEEKAREARNASLALASLKVEVKNKALERIAEAIHDSSESIINENQKDLKEAKKLVEKGELSNSLYKRLQLTEEKINNISDMVLSVAKLDDPIGEELIKTELDNDLVLSKITVPIGVIGTIFESRPDVVAQIGSLCLKSGNAVLMKGGSEAMNSNKILYEIIRDASESEDVPAGWIQLLETRDDVKNMLGLDDYISQLIPRGSNSFVKYIQDNTRIPVLGHAAGICHVFIDKEADLKMAEKIALDAKCQYPAVCNAMETLLVSDDIAVEFLEGLGSKLDEAKVEVRGDNKVIKILETAKAATDEDWATEYNDLILNIKIVSDVTEAVSRINKYGSGHTDAIVTDSK